MLAEEESPGDPENKNRIESKKRLARLQIPRLEVEIQNERNCLMSYSRTIRDYYHRKVVSPYCSGYQQVHPQEITYPDVDINNRIEKLMKLTERGE